MLKKKINKLIKFILLDNGFSSYDYRAVVSCLFFIHNRVYYIRYLKTNKNCHSAVDTSKYCNYYSLLSLSIIRDFVEKKIEVWK